MAVAAGSEGPPPLESEVVKPIVHNILNEKFLSHMLISTRNSKRMDQIVVIGPRFKCSPIPAVKSIPLSFPESPNYTLC